MTKPDDPPLEDLFRPLSAKADKPQYSCGGRPMSPGKVRMAQAKSFAAAVQRRKVDAARRKAGTLRTSSRASTRPYVANAPSTAGCEK